jgi:hypothetical protein
VTRQQTRCVLLPCAGEGRRLGLPYPKEVHFVLPGTAMIDLTLSRLVGLSRPAYLVVVIKPGKDLVLDHIAKRWPDLDFRPVVQSDPGFIGALRAAESFLGDANLLLLPDQFVMENGAFEAAFAAVGSGSSTLMLVHYPEQAEQIADDGAVRIQDGRVAAISEKPGHNRVGMFNAIWCGIGFRGEVADRLITSLELLYTSGDYTPEEWRSSPLREASTIPVEDYSDLGVWDRLTAFQKRHLP